MSESRFRVRYAETDQMGVVYYANYLVWMEVGRTDFCRECGFSYHEMETEAGISIAVAEARCRYRVPARYDDTILVRTSLLEVRSRALNFAYEIIDETNDTLLAEGETRHIAIDKGGRPRSIPERYRRLLSAGLATGT